MKTHELKTWPTYWDAVERGDPLYQMTSGPHLLLLNTGPFTITVRDRFGSTVGDVPGNTRAWLFVKEDGSGNRTPILVG